MARIGSTDLDVFPFCLGGNTFGWSSDEAESFAVLDAYAAAGGNFIDTADAYAAWVPGNAGGESETIIGRWLASRGNRDEMVIATKVGRLTGLADLHASSIHAGIEGSLRRLQTDRIDLYYAHGDDDASIPLAETLGAFDELVRAGKVRHIAASNYEVHRLGEALRTSTAAGSAPFVAFQPHYNLVERGYELELGPLCSASGLACIPYFSLAKGFLTGKYRPGGGDIDSVWPRVRPATSTNAASPCSRPSMRSRPPTRRHRPQLRSPGCSRSRPSSHPSRAPAQPSSSRSCCHSSASS